MWVELVRKCQKKNNDINTDKNNDVDTDKNKDVDMDKNNNVHTDKNNNNDTDKNNNNDVDKNNNNDNKHVETTTTTTCNDDYEKFHARDILPLRTDSFLGINCHLISTSTTDNAVVTSNVINSSDLGISGDYSNEYNSDSDLNAVLSTIAEAQYDSAKKTLLINV